MLRPILAAALFVLVAAPSAAADTFRAGPGQPLATAAEAFEAAADNPGADAVVLVGIDEAGSFDDAAGGAVEVVGLGTTLRGPLTLTDPDSSVRTLDVAGDLVVAGRAESVRVDGDVELGCERGRHLSVAGAVSEGCAAPAAGLSDSLVEGAVDVPTRYCAYPPQPGHAPGPGDVEGTDAAALRDAGDPEPLALDEAVDDLAGRPRMADADGDGIARRDIGALEQHPVPLALPAGNLLRNPGAEDGAAHWTASGTAEEPGVFAAAYGAPDFPSTAAGAALGAGARFFAGGTVPSGTLTQTVDLRPYAPDIDGGGATAQLGALLGGYRADADAGLVELRFLGPDGAAVGVPVSLAPVSAFDRGNAITLLRRSATVAVPPLARSAAVKLTAQRSAGTYADAYFDDVSLTLALPPPAPGEPPPPPPGDPTLRPFSGVAVLTASARPDRRGRVRMRLACADATVGRCAGVLTLVAVLRSDTQARRIGSAGFSLAPGTTRRVRIRIAPSALRRLRRTHRGRMRATLYAAARDGQGLTATATSPLTLTRRR